MTTQLTETERRLLEAIVEMTNVPAAVHSQVNAARVRSRRYTGVGFFIDLAVDPAALAIIPPDLELGAGLYVEIANVPHGAGTVLFVRNGFLSMLELFTFSDPLPSELRITNIQYSAVP